MSRTRALFRPNPRMRSHWCAARSQSNEHGLTHPRFDQNEDCNAALRNDLMSPVFDRIVIHARSTVLCSRVELCVLRPPKYQLTPTLSSMVWSTTPALTKRLCAVSDDEFLEAVNVALTAVPDGAFPFGENEVSGQEGRVRCAHCVATPLLRDRNSSLRSQSHKQHTSTLHCFTCTHGNAWHTHGTAIMVRPCFAPSPRSRSSGRQVNLREITYKYHLVLGSPLNRCRMQ